MKTRTIESTYAGSEGGAIRAMIPSANLRERLKPFVFLDHFNVDTADRWGFPYHPHSGVATFTYPLSSDLHHEDTGGNKGIVSQGGAQWMAAGGGIWHEEFYVPKASLVSGLQLWLTLPPDRENSEVEYQVAGQEKLPVVGNTRVLLGEFGGAKSPIVAPYSLNYFDVSLSSRENWQFDPPVGHNVAWIYNYSGALEVGGELVAPQQLIVLSEDQLRIELRAASEDAGFVIGTAKRTPWPIVASRGSMHTSQEALGAGTRRIMELGRKLHAQGKV